MGSRIRGIAEGGETRWSMEDGDQGVGVELCFYAEARGNWKVEEKR